MRNIRKKIYETVHVYDNGLQSIVYKYFMIATAFLSIVPLLFKEALPVFSITDAVCLVIFVIDYALRWISIDYKIGHHWSSFFKFPFRIFPIIDLMSILSLSAGVLGISGLLRFISVMKVFRVVRILKYSKSVRTIMNILSISRKPLTAVASLALGYILISALIIFNVEPESFDTFFDAIYWATISLTTVGYGDIYPVTAVGRSVAMLSSFFGIAVVALPAGIVTAKYLNDLKDNDKEENR